MNDDFGLKPKKKSRRNAEAYENPLDAPGADKFPLPTSSEHQGSKSPLPHTGKAASVVIPSKLVGNEPRDLPAELSRRDKFTPDEFQERVKARFYRRLEEKSHLLDRDTALRTPFELEQLAGTSKIHAWVKNPSFLDWFLDEHYFEDSMFALRGKAIRRLEGIIDDPVAMDADAIKAIKMVLEQTNPKKQEVRFIDETLNNMAPEAVRAEQARLSAALGELDE